MKRLTKALGKKGGLSWGFARRWITAPCQSFYTCLCSILFYVKEDGKEGEEKGGHRCACFMHGGRAQVSFTTLHSRLFVLLRKLFEAHAKYEHEKSGGLPTAGIGEKDTGDRSHHNGMKNALREGKVRKDRDLGG